MVHDLNPLLMFGFIPNRTYTKPTYPIRSNVIMINTFSCFKTPILYYPYINGIVK